MAMSRWTAVENVLNQSKLGLFATMEYMIRDTMKKIITLLVLVFLLCTKAVFAQNLCDATCNLTITFPDGGSIAAVEPLTFKFGDGGLVDTVSTSTAYMNGNTLVLGAGESLTFDAGGSFDIGAGGNLDYTNIAIVTTGVITIEAVGGAETITLLNMSITDGSLVLNSNTVVETSLSVSGDVSITGNGAIVNAGTVSIVSGSTDIGIIVDSSGGTIISGSGSLTVSSTGSLILSNGQIVIDSTLTSIQLNNLTSVIDISGTLTLMTEITIDGVLYKSDDGLVFKSPDGVTGSIDFVDGSFVFIPDITPQSSGSSGASGLFTLLGLPISIFAFRRRYRVNG